jgi:integrase
MRFGTHRVTLSRADDQASIYYCLYIEGKQYRQSLKTNDWKDAEQKATALTIDLLSKQKAGLKVFSITLAEARKSYLLQLDKRVTEQAITKRSATNTARHILWGIQFLNACHTSANAAMDTIQGKLWSGYTEWRMKQKQSTRTVIKQELTSLKAFFKFAKEAGWCTEANIPKWELEVEKVKRKSVNHEQVTDNLKAVAKWMGSDPKRLMFYTVLQTMLNSGMRTGEVLGLQRSNIETTPKEVTITIDKGKTGERTITIMHSGGYHIREWVREHKEEQLFNYTDFYNTLKQARRDNVLTIDPYHLRHQFAITHLRKGEPPFLVARHMGTSVTMLEKTYGQVITSLIGRQFGKTKVRYLEDGTIEVIER